MSRPPAGSSPWRSRSHSASRGALHAIPGWLALVLTAVFVLLAIPANVPALRRQLVSDGVLERLPQGNAPDVADRARRDRGRHRLVGRRAVLGPAGLGAGCSARRYPTLTSEEQRFLDHDVEELCAMVTDWETTHVYRDLPREVWQFIKDRGFLGMSIAKAYGGLGFLRVRAFAGDDQAVDALRHGLGHGDGAELARPGRAARALRHRRAEALLPAAAGERPGDSVLRAYEPQRRLRCRVHSGLRHRLLGRARREARAGAAGHVGEALHHARARSRRSSGSPSAPTTPTAWSATAKTSASRAR